MDGRGKGILWLASYPKSGNTWLRAFFTNLIRATDSPADINDFLPAHTASSRSLFDDYAGLESSDLTQDEIERLRPRVYELLANAEGETWLVKIHDANTRTSAGEWLVSPNASRGAVYILRNPLDVAVSFAHHKACSIDAIIKIMASESYSLNPNSNRIPGQLRQRLLSWSAHVISWVDGATFPLKLIRFEDLVRTPLETFTDVARFAGLPADPDRIQKAMRFSEFSVLQKQEQAHGFKEKAKAAKSFFRKGTSGSWRAVLTGPQTTRLIQDHRADMQRFGYLDANDEPLF